MSDSKIRMRIPCSYARAKCNSIADDLFNKCDDKIEKEKLRQSFHECVQKFSVCYRFYGNFESQKNTIVTVTEIEYYQIKKELDDSI